MSNTAHIYKWFVNFKDGTRKEFKIRNFEGGLVELGIESRDGVQVEIYVPVSVLGHMSTAIQSFMEALKEQHDL